MDGTKPKKIKKRNVYRQSVGDDLDVLEADKVVKTDAEENKHRRTIILSRSDDKESWGFTIQSYGIHHREKDEVELLTYVDYVRQNSAAFLAGMRPGDVILSINGTNMEEADHHMLIEFIKNCQNDIRMVVLFEDCVRKVELHHRHLKLKRVLAEKMFEVRSLELQERRIMSGLSQYDSFRSNRASTASSCSDFDDRLSLLPELDRCPTPRNNLRNSFTRLPGSPALVHSSPTSSSWSLSPISHLHRQFDFDPSNVLMKKYRKQALRSDISLYAMDNASLRGRHAASGASSPVLKRVSLSPQFDSLPSRKERSPQSQRRLCRSSTPDYSLPLPQWVLRKSAMHGSAPDKLSLSKNDQCEEHELSLFKLHVRDVVTGESTTDSPNVSPTWGDSSNVPSSPKDNLLAHLQSPPKTSSLPQLSAYAEELGLETDNQSTVSLNSSSGSAQFQLESYTSDNSAIDRSNMFSYDSSSTTSSCSFANGAAMEDVCNETAVSHL